jgi:hypothetical protein
MKSTRIRWVGHVARVGERRGVYKVFVEKPEGKTTWETQAYNKAFVYIKPSIKIRS